MDTLHVADALTEIFAVFKRLNKYIDETEPWVLAKDPAKQDRLATVLYNLSEGIIIGASLLAPFLPTTAGKIAEQLGISLRDFDQLGTFGANQGSKVTEKPEILFARLDKEEILKKAEEVQARQRQEFLEHQKVAFANLVKAGRMTQEEADAKWAELTGAKAGAQADGDGKGGADAAQEAIDVEAKPEITYDDFAKLQFQVGEILACEAVKGSKKLLCSKVKVGSQVKQILSGIHGTYEPEEMVGKKVMVLVNLAPRKMAGLMSEGMLLCAEDAEGKLSLMTPEKDMPAGAEIC